MSHPNHEIFRDFFLDVVDLIMDSHFVTTRREQPPHV